MLEKFKKLWTVKNIGRFFCIVGLLLAIVCAFLGKYEATQMTLKMVSCLLITVGLFMMALMAEDHKLFKIIGSLVLAAFIITWILPYGYFNDAEFINYGMRRLGLVDIGADIYYSIGFVVEKVLFIFLIAGVYGVLTKINGYRQLVNSLAEKLSKHKILTALVMMFIIIGFTALTTQSFAVLIFVPFFVSILTKMKVDKLSTFAITYGSVLVGILGALYGTDSLFWFNYYIGVDVTLGAQYRLMILAIAYILYNFFVITRLAVTMKNEKQPEVMEDPFAVENVKKKGHVFPVVIVFVLVAVLGFLGYVSWTNNWNINVFADFHAWLTSLSFKDLYSWLPIKSTFGQDYNLFSYIIGANAVDLGSYQYLYFLIAIMLLGNVVLALINKIKVNEYLTAFYEGMKKVVKPALVMTGVYCIFTIVYMSPFISSMSNWAFGLTESLNPVITSITAFITSVFTADLGYTAYAVGPYLATAYVSNFEIVHTIYTAMYGLVQVFVPSSAVLMFGLALAKVDYKLWFKYIWLFALGMFIILLVFFSVLVYA